MSVTQRIETLGGMEALIADVLRTGDHEGPPSQVAPDDVVHARERRAIQAAAALVCRYAPDAVLREAIARCTGWLVEQPPYAFKRSKVGEVEMEFSAVASLSALRHSGAMALLSPWKVRRGGAI